MSDIPPEFQEWSYLVDWQCIVSITSKNYFVRLLYIGRMDTDTPISNRFDDTQALSKKIAIR